MFWTAVDPVATTIFGLACFLAGVGLTILGYRRKRRPAPQPISRPQIIDVDTDALLADRARQWASQRGRPELAGLAHHRLRTAIAWDQRREEPW